MCGVVWVLRVVAKGMVDICSHFRDFGKGAAFSGKRNECLEPNDLAIDLAAKCESGVVWAS